jgi:large subunit ribosomal protein L10
MPTTRKKAMVRELEELFQKSPVLIFTDYRGLSVADITNLRRQLREKGVEYHVTKNSLTTLASDHAGLGDLTDLLDGPTAIAFVGEDIPGAAKVLGDFVRTSRILQIRGGLVGGTHLSPDQVSDLTKILTREQYIAKMLGSMQSPISGLMSVMTGIIRGFVNVLQARADQMKEQGDGAAPAEAPAVASTEAPVAEAPTAEAATVEAPTAEAPTAEAPVKAPVEAPTAEAATEAPAEASAETPTEPPAAEEPTEEPTEAPE